MPTTLSAEGLDTEHEIFIQNLALRTKYFYSVGCASEVLAGGDANHFFSTSPTHGTQEPTRIWVLGDSGVNTAESALVAQEYLSFVGSDPADVWLMLGDNAYNYGTDTEYTIGLFDNFPKILWPALRNTVLWPSPGNHDFVSIPQSSDPLSETGPYYDAFTLPTRAEAGGIPSGSETHYSFDYANIHFVSLNTYIVSLTPSSAVYQQPVQMYVM